MRLVGSLVGSPCEAAGECTCTKSSEVGTRLRAWCGCNNTGVVEKPISAANWTDALDTLDLRVTFAVPQHRIQYLKCNGEVVWRKSDRLDKFWRDDDGGGGAGGGGGGCADERTAASGGGGGIEAVIANQKANGVIRADGSVARLVADGAPAAGNNSRDKKKQHARTKPKTAAKLAARAAKLKAQDMPTHFLCLRVGGAAVRHAAFRAQTALVSGGGGSRENSGGSGGGGGRAAVKWEGDARLQEGCAVLRSLHITIALIRATTPEQVQFANLLSNLNDR